MSKKEIELSSEFLEIIKSFLNKETFYLVDLYKVLEVEDSSNMNLTHNTLRNRIRKEITKLSEKTHLCVKYQSTYKFYKL